MVAVQSIINELEEHQDPDRGIHVRNYLKTSSLDFLGVPLPTIRAIAKKHAKEVEAGNYAVYLVELWKPPVFDVRRAAAEIILQFQKQGMQESQIISLVDDWINKIDTWALTDPLAWVIGKQMIANPQLRKTLKKWGKRNNYWRRRMAIIPYLELCMRGQYRKEYAPWILTAVTPHIGDSEFFVAKAVGWVLRQLSTHEPELVRQFLRKHQSVMNRVAYREGSRKL